MNMNSRSSFSRGLPKHPAIYHINNTGALELVDSQHRPIRYNLPVVRKNNNIQISSRVEISSLLFFSIGLIVQQNDCSPFLEVSLRLNE